MATPHTQPAPLAPQYLDPTSSLVVMPEDHESAIADVRDALEALSWLGNELASANVRSRQAGLARQCDVIMPPEAFSALLNVIRERLTASTTTRRCPCCCASAPTCVTRGAPNEPAKQSAPDDANHDHGRHERAHG